MRKRRLKAAKQAKLIDYFVAGSTVRSDADLVITFERNIAALEAIQPVDLTPAEITARLGATWIPTDDLGDFVAEVIEANKAAVRVDYFNNLATWTITAKDAVKGNVANLTTYGTSRFTALNLLEDALNGVVPTAYDIRRAIRRLAAHLWLPSSLVKQNHRVLLLF